MKTPPNKLVPTLAPSDLDQHHFYPWADWQPWLATDHNLFHVNRIETYRNYMKFPLSPHRKTVFDFIFLTKGHSVRSKGLDSYEFAANDFFFLPAYQITTHESMSADAEGYFCHFDAQIIHKNFSKHDFSNEFTFLQFAGNPVVKTQASFMPVVQPVLQLLEAEYQQDQPFRLDLVSFLLLALFTDLKRATQAEKKVAENSALRITRLYKEALSQYIYQKHSVTEYADLLAVSPNHLNKCVKSVTGKSAQDLLNDMILLEVKVLLLQTDMPIKEIAYQMTKWNPSDLTRFFKIKTGLTPKEYKKMD